jgi:outer membrane murein-binding lipoprotein Lpp
MSRAPRRNLFLKGAALVLIGGLSVSGCATKKYVDEQIATVNDRVNAVDAKATDAIQRADAANAAAQSGGSAAQAAAGDARSANERIDQLTTRVDAMEQRNMRRSPRN